MVDNSPHVQLAMTAIREYVELGRVLRLQKADLSDELLTPSASFVSLKKAGDLRGCIGTVEPVKSTLAEEIVMNGISAATKDPRFPPIQPYELDSLVCSVDVLFPPEEIPEQCMLDPLKYGVIVQCGFRRGLLLPNLEGIDSIEMQVDIARRKASISPNEQVKLYRFEVKRYY